MELALSIPSAATGRAAEEAEDFFSHQTKEISPDTHGPAQLPLSAQKFCILLQKAQEKLLVRKAAETELSSDLRSASELANRIKNSHASHQGPTQDILLRQALQASFLVAAETWLASH